MTSQSPDDEVASEPRAVAVALQKGGVGKTTIAINLADALTQRGHNVLLVDADQQGNATDGVGMGDLYDAENHLGDILRGNVPVRELTVPTGHGFDLLPSHQDLDEVAAYLQSQTAAIGKMRSQVVEPVLGEDYDYIVIDVPPSLGALSDSSLFAARNLVIPMLMSEASVGGFQRMMDQQVRPLRDVTKCEILALVPNRLQGDNEERRILGNIEETSFGDLLPTFGRSSEYDVEGSPGPGIRERVAFRRAFRDGVPLSKFDGEADMLPRFDELAQIVEHGGVN